MRRLITFNNDSAKEKTEQILKEKEENIEALNRTISDLQQAMNNISSQADENTKVRDVEDKNHMQKAAQLV